jgi:hypothetical protein
MIEAQYPQAAWRLQLLQLTESGPRGCHYRCRRMSWSVDAFVSRSLHARPKSHVFRDVHFLLYTVVAPQLQAGSRLRPVSSDLELLSRVVSASDSLHFWSWMVQ